ncbi:MAG: hypothetical protein RSE58_13845, partial [Clostridia bacterium]
VRAAVFCILFCAKRVCARVGGSPHASGAESHFRKRTVSPARGRMTHAAQRMPHSAQRMPHGA